MQCLSPVIFFELRSRIPFFSQLPFRDESSEINPLFRHPAPIRPNGGEFHLDGLVVEYASLRSIDDEHLPRL
ncbi:MAG TPA: hypothetical protein VIO12_05910, partial [Thermoanaerobaculia bacterium]